MRPATIEIGGREIACLRATTFSGVATEPKKYLFATTFGSGIRRRNDHGKNRNRTERGLDTNELHSTTPTSRFWSCSARRRASGPEKDSATRRSLPWVGKDGDSILASSPYDALLGSRKTSGAKLGGEAATNSEKRSPVPSTPGSNKAIVCCFR